MTESAPRDGSRPCAQVAIVMGVGQPLSRSLALQLAAHGTRVVVNGERADEVAAAIRQSGGHAIAHRESVVAATEAAAIVSAALTGYGRLDVVVHDSKLTRSSASRAAREVDWDAEPPADTRCQRALTTAACAYWDRSGRQPDEPPASILFLAPAGGLNGRGGRSHYSAACADIAALSDEVAERTPSTGVVSNVIGWQSTRKLALQLDAPDPTLEKEQPREHAIALALLLACEPGRAVTGWQFVATTGGVFLNDGAHNRWSAPLAERLTSVEINSIVERTVAQARTSLRRLSFVERG